MPVPGIIVPINGETVSDNIDKKKFHDKKGFFGI
jgi:hypothetical protein